eukprot:gene26730-33354_t
MLAKLVQLADGVETVVLPRLRQVNTITGIITTFAGNGNGGQTSGDGGPATCASFGLPEGLWKDTLGNLFVSITNFGLIRKIDISGIISAFAGAPYISSQGDDGPATSAQFSGPNGIYGDGDNKLYLTESDNHKIRVIFLDSGKIYAFAGTGSAESSGVVADGPASSVKINNPTGVTGDSRGNLYICEFLGMRVKKITNGIMSTLVGLVGDTGSTSDGGPLSSATLKNP